MALIKVKPGVPQKMDAGDNPSFDEWMKKVDSIISRHFGIDTNDLPDVDYYRWYEQRLRPIRAANRALKYAGADMFDNPCCNPRGFPTWDDYTSSWRAGKFVWTVEGRDVLLTKNTPRGIISVNLYSYPSRDKAMDAAYRMAYLQANA